jgi:hypothetical protein
MGGVDNGRSRLTRSLLAGVALGSVAVVQVGCATQDGGFQPAAGRATASGTEAELCSRALASGDYRDVDALLRAYPNGSCVPATLTAMPPQTLSRLSPSVLARLSPATIAQVPAEQAIYLRTAARNDNSSSGSGPSGRGGPY